MRVGACTISVGVPRGPVQEALQSQLYEHQCGQDLCGQVSRSGRAGELRSPRRALEGRHCLHIGICGGSGSGMIADWAPHHRTGHGYMPVRG